MQQQKQGHGKPIACCPVGGLQRNATVERGEGVGVAFEDIPKAMKWAESGGKEAMRGQEWNSFYLAKAVVERCKQLYGKEGNEKVNAAIVHYMDINDYLAAAAAKRDDPVVQRVRQALLADRERVQRVRNANNYLERAELKRKEDSERLPCPIAGGGKCNFEPGTSREQVRINDGGPSYDQLFPPETVKYYKRVAKPVNEGFPASLWSDGVKKDA